VWTCSIWRFDFPKGHVDVSRQLDALAHVIAKDDIKKVAVRWGITRNGVYQLARSALKRLRGVSAFTAPTSAQGSLAARYAAGRVKARAVAE